jgi:hypothetical protein
MVSAPPEGGVPVISLIPLPTRRISAVEGNRPLVRPVPVAWTLRDCLDALGGRLEMFSTPGSGTRLRAAIPASAAVQQ